MITVSISGRKATLLKTADLPSGNDNSIKPNEDKFWYYISINKQLQLSYVSAYCWYIRASNSPKRYKFRELLGEKQMIKITEV